MSSISPDKSLLMVNTGDGKGKTTAAFGQAMRVAGNGGRVCIIQFIKGKWQTGEALAVQAFADNMEIHIKGSGFTWQADDLEDVKREGGEAWAFARRKISSNAYDLVVLDELTYLITYGMVSEEEVVDALSNRPGRTNIVVTGRGASAGLLAVADMVTEMRGVKHHFKRGIKARKGIEF